MPNLFPGLPIGDNFPVLVIAELGSNHNGSLDIAKKHIDVAVEAGCNSVKFQFPFANEGYPPGTRFGDIYGDIEIGNLIKKNEVSIELARGMNDYARAHGLLTGSSGDGYQALAMMKELKFDFLKIPSFTISHIPLLKEMEKLKLPVILSTGRHTIGQTDEAVRTLPNSLAGVLHCISAYPTPLDQLNLSTIPFLKQAFDTNIGFSDHSLDPIKGPGLAVALGARIIEKHFTLDRNMQGPDHFYALEPNELKAMVDEIKKVDSDPRYAESLKNRSDYREMLGTPKNGLVQAEEAFFSKTRLGLYYTGDFEKGHRLKFEDIRVYRCADTEPGLHPRFMENLIGAKINKDVEAANATSWADVIDYN